MGNQREVPRHQTQQKSMIKAPFNGFDLNSLDEIIFVIIVDDAIINNHCNIYSINYYY